MFIKILRYFRENGFKAVLLKTSHKIYYSLMPAWNFLYYMDLMNADDCKEQEGTGYKIVNRDSESSLEPEESAALQSHLGPDVYKKQTDMRFDQHYSRLWLAKDGSRVLGFAWTVIQNTVEPFYWPLTEKDVHIYHVMVFPENRGKGIAGQILKKIISAYKQEDCQRIYVEVLTSNHSSNRLMCKSGFRVYGVGRRFKRRRLQIAIFRRDWKKYIDQSRL